MKSFMRNFFLLAPFCLFFSSVNASNVHWTYHGDQGPAHWGKLGNSLCAGGVQQSPIDVDMNQVQRYRSSNSDFKFSYEKAPLVLINNGHTIQANVIHGGTVTFQGSQYRLVQYHFHTPSEHQINHLPYPMEMHLVNQDQNGRLLVMGLMVKEGKENTELASLWSQLPKVEGKEVSLRAETAPNLNKLIPMVGHHLFYKGSLTTPPCTEGVQWVLFEQPIVMSKSQIRKFRSFINENSRPVQPAEGREVVED